VRLLPTLVDSRDDSGGMCGLNTLQEDVSKYPKEWRSLFLVSV
jgi:hypothetical protein